MFTPLNKPVKRIYPEVKFLFLILTALVLFPFFITPRDLRPYASFVVIFILFLSLLHWLSVGWHSLKIVFKLWSVGFIIYFIIAIPFIYSGKNLSPGLILPDLVSRWIYSLLYPLRLLGILLAGIIFVETVSPVDFIKYGKFGYHLAFFMRSIQVTMENLNANKKALIIMGELRENNFADYLKKSPLIISLTIRNMMIWLFWSSNNIEKLKNKKECEK